MVGVTSPRDPLSGQEDLPPGPLPEREDLPPGPLPEREGVVVKLGEGEEGPGETPADVMRLVERMVACRPRLVIPLAQEIPGCRAWAARRAIRAGMTMTALLGAEPIPLLDLPLQVSLNWKVALEVAAIFGHTGLDHRSRELLATVAWNLVLRYLIQQAVKVVPLLGWGVSAGLSALGTWAFGNALLHYYLYGEHGGQFELPQRLRQAEETWRRRQEGVKAWFAGFRRRRGAEQPHQPGAHCADASAPAGGGSNVARRGSLPRRVAAAIGMLLRRGCRGEGHSERSVSSRA